MGAPQPDGQDVDAGRPGQPGQARLPGHRVKVVGDGSFGEDVHAAARSKRGGGGVEGGGVTRPPLDRDLTHAAQTGGQDPVLEQLRLGQEPHPPPGEVGQVGDGDRVEIGEVVRRQQHRPLGGNALHALDPPAQTPAHGRAEQDLDQPVEQFHRPVG